MNTVSKMWMGLDSVRKRTNDMPSKAYAQKSYLDAMARDVGMVEDNAYATPKGAMGAFCGMPVYEAALPQGLLCVFMDKDNKVVGRIVDETYTPPVSPTNKPEDGK